MRRLVRRGPRPPWSLRRRLMFAQGGMVLPLVIVAAIGAMLLITDDAAYKRSNHRVRASTEIALLQTTLTSVQSQLMRPPTLAGEPAAVAEFNATMSNVDRSLDTLSGLLPEHGQALTDIRAGWTRMRGSLLANGFGSAELLNNMYDLRKLGEILTHAGGGLNTALTGLNDLASANAKALEDDLAAGHGRLRTQQFILMVLAVVALGAAVKTARWLHASITRPLGALREAARHIGEDIADAPGDTPPIDLANQIDGGVTEELAEVAGAFNAMSERLANGRVLLASRERWFRSLVQSSSDIVAVTDPRGFIRYASPPVERVLGHDATAVTASGILDLLHPEDAEHVRVRLVAASSRSGLTDPIHCRMRHSNGDWRHVEIVANNKLDDPAIDGLVLTIRDVTDAHRLREQLTYQAFHDDLTGLANRGLFADRLGHALTRRADNGDYIAVLFLDLDDFKGVNDTLGHSAGDTLLREIATRVRALLREDTTAARLGGDEFAVLLDRVDTTADAENVAERLLAAIRRPMLLGTTEVFPRASAGIVVTRPGEGTAEELLRRADTAMYQAKACGKDTVAVYTDKLAEHALRRLELSADLRHAVERQQLEIYYQPTIHLDSGAVTGVEALLRWRHPVHGFVSPVEFIPLAEETGAIIEIGRWVLTEACRQAAEWKRGDDAPDTMSVNLSGRQLQHPRLLHDVQTALATSGLAAGSLVLEITESEVLRETDELLELLHALKALGIRLAIDDFGTGYSSLSYLQRLPIDILKIDRSFVNGMADADGLALAATILNLAQTLQLETVAEGVEKPDQADLLRQLRCDLAQGFYYARPQPAAQLPGAVARIRQPHGAEDPRQPALPDPA